MSFRSFSRASSSVSLWLLLSTPAVVSAEVLWRGDFESGDLNQFGTLLNATKGERKNINVVMTPVHGGTRAAEVVIHPDDLWQGNNHNRVELHYDAVEARTAEGQTTYFSFYFRLPANAQTTNDIAYWETANTYQQSMAFWIQPMGGGTQLSFRTNHPSGMTHFNGPVSVNEWHQLAMQILWSENASTGKVNVWLDGRKIVDNIGAKTKPDSNRVFIQMGYHRNASAQPVETIYLDDAIEATTLAEVLSAGGGSGGGGAGGSGGASAGMGGSVGGSGGASAGAGGASAGATNAGAAGQAIAGAPGTSGSAGQSAMGGSGGASGGASTGGANAGAPSAAGTGTGAPSAGAPGAAGAASAGRPSTSGAAGATGAPSSGEKAEDGGGCAVGNARASAWPLALLGLAAALRRRRRQ